MISVAVTAAFTLIQLPLFRIHLRANNHFLKLKKYYFLRECEEIEYLSDL